MPKKKTEAPDRVSVFWSVIRIGLAVLFFILFITNIKNRPGPAFGYLAVCFAFAEWQGIRMQKVIDRKKGESARRAEADHGSAREAEEAGEAAGSGAGRSEAACAV